MTDSRFINPFDFHEMEKSIKPKERDDFTKIDKNIFADLVFKDFEKNPLEHTRFNNVYCLLEEVGNDKFLCACGGEIKKSNKSHSKSKRHLEYFKNLEECIKFIVDSINYYYSRSEKINHYDNHYEEIIKGLIKDYQGKSTFWFYPWKYSGNHWARKKERNYINFY